MRPYTPATLAERWDVSPDTIRRMCADNRLPSFRVGVAYRIPADVVEAWERCRGTIDSPGSRDGQTGTLSSTRTDDDSVSHSEPRSDWKPKDALRYGEALGRAAADSLAVGMAAYEAYGKPTATKTRTSG